MHCRVCAQDRHISEFQKDRKTKTGVRMPCRRCRTSKLSGVGKTSIVDRGASVGHGEASQQEIMESLLKKSGGSVIYHPHLKRFAFLSHTPFIHVEDSSFSDLLESAGKKLQESQSQSVEVL